MGKRYRQQERTYRPTLDALIAEVEDNGWTVVFVEFCEDIETPGIIGLYAGVCDSSRKKIKVSTRYSLEGQVAILSHEIEHMHGAHWATDHEHLGLRCGGRATPFELVESRSA